jgi:hypothetical protein
MEYWRLFNQMYGELMTVRALSLNSSFNEQETYTLTDQ